METHKIAGNNMYMLRILPKITNAGGNSRPMLEVATENLEDILDWQKRIEDARNAIESHQHEVYKKEQLLKQQSRSKRIALEMSDLVIYCRPVPFSLEGKGVRLLPHFAHSDWSSLPPPPLPRPSPLPLRLPSPLPLPLPPPPRYRE